MSPQFEEWWERSGSARRPTNDEDIAEFAKFIAWESWHRATYTERKRCISTVTEWIKTHNTTPAK